MKYLQTEITAEGYTARLSAYLLDYYDDFDKGRRRPAMLICPGGAYWYTSVREAEPVAVKFSSFGYQTFVLDYSCAPTGAVYPVAFKQALLSIGYIRKHAEEFHIDPEHIAIMGFSAGGHLAANVSTDYMNEKILSEIGCTVQDVRPNASVLCYPVISTGEYAHKGSIDNLLGKSGGQKMRDFLSLEHRVSESTPPTFIWHTFSDESVPVENSLYYALALKKHNVTCELHVFPFGPHGLSLANPETSHPGNVQVVEECTQWPDLAERFLSQCFSK